MEHPVVYEALEIMRNEKQIKELIGYPIDIKYRMSQSSTLTKDNDDNENAYFSFFVKGPRGEVNVVMSGSAMKVEQIKESSTLD